MGWLCWKCLAWERVMGCDAGGVWRLVMWEGFEFCDVSGCSTVALWIANGTFKFYRYGRTKVSFLIHVLYDPPIVFPSYLYKSTKYELVKKTKTLDSSHKATMIHHFSKIKRNRYLVHTRSP